MRAAHAPLRLPRPDATRALGRGYARRAGAAAGALLLAALLALPFLGGGLARADDAPPAAPSPLGRLRPEERAVLERKIPGLSELPLEKQEQIVRNVERLRSLDPQALERVKQRLREADQAGLRGERLDERVRDWAGLKDKQGPALLRGQGIHAVGQLAWRRLPPEMRADPAVARVGERVFSTVFHGLFWGQAWRSLPAEEALSFEPPAGAPEGERARWLELRERARGNPQLLGRLQEELLRRRALEAARAVLGPPPGGEGHGPAPAPGSAAGPGGERLLALGERLRELAPKAFDDALAQLVAQWREKGGERWAQGLLEKVRPPEPAPEMLRQVETVRFVLALEEFAARHGPLAAAADTLLRAALVDDLRMPADEFERLPPRGDAAAQARRREALLLWAQRGGLPPEVLRWALFKAWTPGERMGGAFPGRGQRPVPPGGRRGPGVPPGREGEAPPPKDGERREPR